MASEQRFASVKEFIEDHGWKLVRIRGSHHVFSKPGARNIVMAVHHGKVADAYVRHAKKVIKEWEQKQGD